MDEPSKTMFDLFILPFSLAILANQLPRAALASVVRTHPLATSAALALLLVCAVGGAADDARDSVCTRLALPEDVANRSLREVLVAARSANGPAAERRRQYEGPS